VRLPLRDQRAYEGRQKVAYIEGNRDHPINKGVLCAKGSAGIMQHYSPARLKKPLKRVGKRGEGEFKEIELGRGAGLGHTMAWQGAQHRSRKLAFFTGRDQSQSMTGWWAQALARQIMPRMAASARSTWRRPASTRWAARSGNSAQPDWERTKLFMMFGVAEDHDSNPIKMGLGKLKARGAKVIGVNPVRTGYNAIADEWVGITPGTDGLFILALIHELMRTGQDRSRLSGSLHQCALAGDRRSRRARPRAVCPRRRRQAAW
jgi:anaerobic selenocysteine-containing dehydrogenase